MIWRLALGITALLASAGCATASTTEPAQQRVDNYEHQSPCAGYTPEQRQVYQATGASC